MPDPSGLPDIDNFVNLILNVNRVGIFGDYDVDGISSVAIWVKFFKKIGTECFHYIPTRSDGYGASNKGLDFLLSKDVDLILFLDCGSSSVELIKNIKVKTAIIDHHQAFEFAQAEACINPYRFDCEQQLKYRNLCTAGLSFLVLSKFLDHFPQLDLMSMLDLVGIATIADVMPIDPFNRACIRRSLELINKGKNLGLTILAEKLKLKLPITSTSLAFYIIPALNAAGRLGNPELSLKLLTSEIPRECLITANYLDVMNRERKVLTKNMFEMAKTQVYDDAVIVVKDERWHPGIVGITASQLQDAFNKTSFVFYKSGDFWKGSARSNDLNLGKVIIESINLGLAASGGGHSAAAGICIHRDFFDEWRAWINSKIDIQEEIVTKIKVDAIIPEILLDSMPTFHEFGPFGNGNSSLNLVVQNVWIKNILPGLNYLQCILSSGIKILSFRAGNDLKSGLSNSIGKTVDLLLKVDEHGGFILDDARAS